MRSEIGAMTRERKTVKAILDALPSTHDPEVMSLEELRSIGRKLYPEGMRIMVNPDAEMREVCKVVWELLGKGFLLATPFAMPYWMYKLMEMRQEEVTDNLLEAMWHTISTVREPIRQSKQWIWLCQGHTEDEVIANQMQLEVGYAVEAIIDDRGTENEATSLIRRYESLEDE